MNNTQQIEALVYFNKFAQDWKRISDNTTTNDINVIKQRNDYVIDIINNRKNTESFLDVGCGTGNLVYEVAQKGINATGIDFAKEMINIAKKSQMEKTKFECCSIFDFCFESNKYDVISANGLIEYFSYQEINKFLEITFENLKTGGSLILGSRNRLFNIFSLNKFTEEEINENTINLLLLEAIQIVKSDDIKNLFDLKTTPFQNEGKKHHLTGIEVSTRHQFTPVQLINKLNDKGFKPIEIFPIHIHSVPLMFKDEYPTIHGNISNLLQKYAKSNMSLIPYSSTFMIHAKKD